MRKVIFFKFQAVFATGIISVFAVLSPPALSQEAEAKGGSILFESTITKDVDPSKAVTIDDLTIPIDQLELLVKPLTLEELQIETAAWLLLLRNKVQEISAMEITIKRDIQLIQEKKNAAKALDDAKAKLADAEAALGEASPDTPEYQKAAKKLEQAKQALKEAKQALKEAVEKSEEFEKDQEGQEALDEAKIEQQIAIAQEILEEARKERDKLTIGSAVYDAATDKIDTLDQALIDLEAAEDKLQSAVPESAKYQQLSKEFAQARVKVIKAAEAIKKSGLAPSAASVESEDSETAQKDLKNQLVVNVTNLQSEQTAIIDRFNVVLDALDDKGGDTASYRKYLDAVSGIEIDITDREGLGVRLVGWLKSD
ncbi:MAG: small-conductance mechanosensitive channel, partial [Moorea sp. SIO2B7]|nr:small-conductance mechanosensitive channel [Moorena sp. SIO2B7]